MHHPPDSAASPDRAQDAPGRPATNRTAPVRAGSRGAAESAGGGRGAECAATGGGADRGAGTARGAERGTATSGAADSTGGPTTGAGIAGMAGPAGVGRPDVRLAEAAGAAAGAGAAGTAPRAAPPTPRTVLHVDIDAFFAAIEQLRDPRLCGRPVIVGAGVIASCSYEARRFGLHAGMTLSEARRLCPQAVILEGHAQVYRCFAERIFERCRALSPDVETYLDEAYLELTGTERLHGDFLAAAAALKRAIRDDTGLGVTCGLGPNRMLAKLVGRTSKPDGLARLDPAHAEAFLVERPIEQLAGVGHAHARTLRSMNVRTIGALRALPVGALTALFGAPGRLLYERCRGRDTAPVTAREIPLTISRETSFHADTADPRQIEGMLEYLVGRACRTAREQSLTARTVAVRLRYADGQGEEQARSLPQPSAVDPVVLALARELLARLFRRRVALHAVGVTLSRFARDAAEQGALFDEREAGRRAALCQALDRVRGSYGHGAVVSGRALHLKGRVAEDRHGFVLRTPSLTR